MVVAENIYNYYIRTIIGSFVCRASVRMEGEMRKNIYTFGATDKTPYQIIKNRKKATRKEFLFAKYVAKGEDMVDAFMKHIPTDNRNYAEREAKAINENKKGKSLIREEIEKIMNEAEITPLYIL
jgi:hypothetical protein